jgi:DNA-binding transcriptional LysR family regulator
MTNNQFLAFDRNNFMTETPLDRMPTLAWLRAFEAAARLRNFTAAGDELGLTQAAVSQQIKLLEASLKTMLFVRLRRGVELTAEGAAYLPHVQASFRSLAESTTALFGRRARHTVHILSPISFAALWIAPRLAAFFAALPDTQIEIGTIHAPSDYGARPGGFDIRFGTGVFPGRISHRLTSERLVPVASPHFVSVGDREAIGQKLPLLSVAGAREMWPDWFALARLPAPRHTGLRCDSFVIAYEAARAGAGILLGSRPLVDTAIRLGQLTPLSEVELAGTAGHFITYAEGSMLTPRAQRVLDWWVEESG